MNMTHTNAIGAFASGFAPTLRCQSTLITQPDSRSRSLIALMSAGMALNPDSASAGNSISNILRETSIG